MDIVIPGLRVHMDGHECRVHVGRYADSGNIGRQLYDTKTGYPYATATINPSVTLIDDQVMIKNYSENRGMVDALRRAGVIGEAVAVAGVDFPVYRLTVPLPDGLATRGTVFAN